MIGAHANTQHHFVHSNARGQSLCYQMTLHRVWSAPITVSAKQNLMARNGLRTQLLMYSHQNPLCKSVLSRDPQISAQRGRWGPNRDYGKAPTLQAAFHADQRAVAEHVRTVPCRDRIKAHPCRSYKSVDDLMQLNAKPKPFT